MSVGAGAQDASRALHVGASNPPEVETILDAAEAQFADVGLKLTTVGDIARRAGVGRVTIYRRVGGRDEIAHAVSARSAARLIDEIRTVAHQADTLDTMIGSVFATTVERMREHPVWNRMLALEPESSLLRLTVDGQDILVASIAATVAILEDAADAGLLTDTRDLPGKAEVLVRVAHSVILTPHALVPLATREHLEQFARSLLLPLLSS
ncbi:TetR/AcrR family transcriptional regulator [Rhodococcus sp. HNM0569]|uniref:TetR/AcrR family transcriptional regulator n=1 Tax=Rhodococcus sp. HNM0569 TaxID=2716340 RepID=UPI00146D2727|nr:TetR/AcrR family transcriptional regulator [Rhodococcus sp. HNM0569]NLU83681.1 helix-turn-helix transcriptional regulator [Rhodococcus sp. HNM0569]